MTNNKCGSRDLEKDKPDQGPVGTAHHEQAPLLPRIAPRSFVDRIILLSRGLISVKTIAVNKTGIGLAVVSPPCERVHDVHLAIEPAPPTRRPLGKWSRPWLANHTSGKDVAQTPSNLG